MELNKKFTAEKTSESAEELNTLTGIIIGAAKVERQVELPLCYKGNHLDCGYRLDLLVNDIVIVEIKAVNGIAPIHHAQLTSYLKISGCKVGLLINFNVTLLKDGVTRIVNKF